MSFCNNCHYPLTSETKYCSHCGQKNTDGRVTVRSLISDFFGIVFNLDNQLFRSLAALIVPGRLTNEYFKGRIKRYFHPIRMFFVQFFEVNLVTIFGYPFGDITIVI